MGFKYFIDRGKDFTPKKKLFKHKIIRNLNKIREKKLININLRIVLNCGLNLA